MDNIVKNTEINTECVESYFEKSALSHKDINAVLDVSNTKEAIHSNIYRDYFTKKYLQKNVSPNKSDSILDFGCGVGRITYSFSKFANRVDGIDTSKNMIEVAAAKKVANNKTMTGLCIRETRDYGDGMGRVWLIKREK